MKELNFTTTGISTEAAILGNRIYTDRTVEVNDETYRYIASRLKEEIGDSCYYNGSIETDSSEIYSTFTASLIIYRTDESYPEGNFKSISDIVPVWWEYSTEIAGHGEVLNDFCFSGLKKAMLSVN